MSEAIVATESAAELRKVEREVQRAFRESPLESEVLLTLLNVAAFSSRASTALEVVTQASGQKSLLSDGEDSGDVNVDAVRHAVTHVTERVSYGNSFANMMSTSDGIAALRLLHTALCGNGGHGDHGVILRRRDETSPRFSMVDRAGRSYWRFDMSSRTSRAETTSMSTAFHGSPAENWLSILHGGLRVLPASHSAENGRVYGEGVYLARNFDTAAGFAPMTSLKTSTCTRIRAICVVGEFAIIDNNDSNINNTLSLTTSNHSNQRHYGTDSTTSNDKSWLDVPQEYIVVADSSRVRLVALHVLACLAPEGVNRSRTGTLRRTSRMSILNGAVNKVNAFWILVISYVFWLVWIGRDS